MRKRGLEWIALFFGTLMIMSVLSIPAQAWANVPLENHYAANPTKKPTKTKRPKPTPTRTPIPRSTPISSPSPTSTGVWTNTPSGLATQKTSTPGTPGTPTQTSSAPTSVFPTVSPTSTALQQNTQIAQQTQTAGVLFLTSTSLALSRTPTPTSINAPTYTSTFTPNASELTATAIVPATASIDGAAQVAASPTNTVIVNLPTAISTQPSAYGGGLALYWIIGISFIVIPLLFFLLYKEWKKE